MAPSRNIDLIALDEALTRLAVHDSRKAELVKLRYFAGLSLEQAGAALGISVRTAKRDWAYARAITDAVDPEGMQIEQICE